MSGVEAPLLASPSLDTSENAQLLAALARGDRLAFLRISRMVTGFLAQMRAYDFREDWPDLVQEVVLVVVSAHAQGQLRDPDALLGFVRSVTRNKLGDRLRRELRLREEVSLLGEIAAFDALDARAAGARSQAYDLRRALAELPEKKRLVVSLVYLEGKSYEEAAAESGIPLGSLKRYLREGLEELRQLLGEERA